MMGKMEVRSPPGSRPRDGRHCDLCGCSQPAVRCDKCGCQIFCLSCDDMYHRHPKRRFHLRKAVDSIPPVPQARPVLPMKVSHLNATNPGDPSKMPLPPPRKKKSLFSSFRKTSPSSDNSPPLPKKEYSWTDRLGSIKKFMSNRPLPPLPSSDDNESDFQPATNGQVQKGDLSFIHKRTDERPPQLPQRSPRSPDFPGFGQEKENRIPAIPPHLPGQIRNGSVEPNMNHMNQNHEFNSNDPNQWNNRVNHQNDAQAFGTLNRQRPFMPPGAPGYPGTMHQSSSATDLHNMHNAEGMHGAVPPHYPHYPMNPHMPPHYPYPMYPGYPNYPQYFGNSFANLSNPPTSEGDFSDSESSSRHSSKRHAFRKRAKRSQSVVVDRMAYPGQFFPFGPYPGYGPWGAPMQMETPPSPASSVRSLNRSGRTRRRKKGTSEDDDEELSETSSPMSRPKSSSSDPKENPRAPLATQTTSSEDESDDDAAKRRNKINTIKRQSEPVRSPSPALNKKVAKLKKSSSKQSDSDTQESPATRNDRRPSDSTTEQQQPVRQSPVQQQPVRQSPVQQQSNVQRSPTPKQLILRESPVAQSTPSQPQASNTIQSESWECRHCTFMNPIGNRICQVCCKTATPRTETPVSSQSRPSSSSAKNRKDSVGSENEYFVPEDNIESEASKKDKQDMASLNSALDEAEKQISKGLEELMKLKDDIDSTVSKEKTKSSEIQSSEDKPVYKSSGRMRTSILDKLNLNKSQTSVSTSTETQTDQNRTVDKIIEARRRLSNSSTASETYNSPLAQSPDLDREYLGNKQKRDSSCQTQQDSITEYLEKRKAAEESYLGRPINNFGFGYGDRMDMMTSPVPSMYDRFYGGGYGLGQRSHSRASLFTGRMNDFGPMDYGPGPGFGYGAAPMYRSVSRGSLTDYPDGRLSGFHSIRKPDYYLSMEELVERRTQDNINNIRAQGLELVRMIREAEQQGFNADDIQVALTHCGKQNPLEWLQENWRNMVDSVVTLSTNYGNDKKENDIGLLSENEARDALRLHKGNIWAAVTECVEGRQRKYLELNARGNFSRQGIVDSLTSSEGDVEMAYAKLTKSTGKPFLMRIWGQGEGAQNQDGARPMAEDFRDGPHRYLKDDTFNNDDLSDDLWSDDEAVDWDDEEDYEEEERGDIEDLRTCQEDLPSNPQEIRTPESEKSDYLDAFSVDDRNVSSPSDDIFFVIPEAKPEKKKGFLSKLVAMRRDSKERSEVGIKESVSSEQDCQPNEDSTSQKITAHSEIKNGGALNTLKNKFSAIKDTVTGGTKNDKKMPTAQVERRTIIVRGQLEHESLSTKEETKSTPIENSSEERTFSKLKSDAQNKEQVKQVEESQPKADSRLETEAYSKTSTLNLSETNQMKAENFKVENKSREIDPKKAENKSSQSLAERLKSAKQNRSSFDAPGPSGITKETLMQSVAKREETQMQSTKETSLEKPVNISSKIIPEIEGNLEKTNIDKVANFHNLEKSETKKDNTFINQRNQQIPENAANLKIVKSDDIKSTEAFEAEKFSKAANQNLLKESNLVTPTKFSKTSNLTNKSQNSNILDTKREISSKSHTDEVMNKQSVAEVQSQINPENVALSQTSAQKVKENKPSSSLKAKEEHVNQTQVVGVAKQNDISERDTSTPEANLPKINAPSKQKMISSHQETPETALKILKEFSPKISDTKVSNAKVSDIKDATKQKGNDSTANNQKSNMIKEEIKTVQPTEHKTVNIETSVEIFEMPKTDENSKNSQITNNQNALEKSQESLQETKSKVIVSTKEDTAIIKNNENVSKDIDSAKTIPENNFINNDVNQTITTAKIPKTDKTHKTIPFEKIAAIETDVPSTYDVQKDDIVIKSEQIIVGSDANKTLKETNAIEIPKLGNENNLIKSEQNIVNSDANKTLKETNTIAVPKQDSENNFEISKSLSGKKSIAEANETSSDLTTISSNEILENPSLKSILENSNDSLKLDKSEFISPPGEVSSNILIPNQTNIVQNLDMANKENSSASNKNEHIENLQQISLQNTEVTHRTDINTSSTESVEPVFDNSHSPTETKRENETDSSKISPEINKGLLSHTVAQISKQAGKDEDTSIIASIIENISNSTPSTSSLSDLVQTNGISIVDRDKNLKGYEEILNKNTIEQNKSELSVKKKEAANVINSDNKITESELKISEIKEIKSPEKVEPLSADTGLEKSSLNSFEAAENSTVSTESQNKLISDATPSQLKENIIPSNVHGEIKEQVIGPISESHPSKSTNENSSSISNARISNETNIQEPVFSKEFPNKNVVEVPESLVLPANVEKAVPRSTEEKINIEPLPSASNNSDNLNLADNVSKTSTLDNDETKNVSLNTNNFDNTPSTSKNVPNNSETIVEHKNVPTDTKSTTGAASAENSVIDDKSLSAKITESSKIVKISSDTNTENTSTPENISSVASNVDDSIKEVVSNTAASTVATTSASSSANIADSSKAISPLAGMADSDTSKSKENTVAEHSTSSSDAKSLSNDVKSSSPKSNEQHSKIPETVAVSSSASTSITNSNPTHTMTSVKNRKFQRSVSEDKKETDTSESEEDTDTEYSYSDNSRRGSLMLPSPVDTLRSRFEGLASGAAISSGPIRPASPFRRMSFNSRKQVIALERKKDTAVDKPWYHKIDPEPVKIVQPKRSIKQQLEMERKVRKMVADRKCRTYRKAEIVVQLMDMNFEEEEAIQAANECSTLEQSISYLQQECLLCAGHFPVSLIVSMTHCEHRACRECIRAYFTVQIRDRTILDLLCPFCNEPDIGDEDVAQDYFNHLDIMLKKLVDAEIHELFQRKLRDRVLMKDPNFRWCSQCSSGFIAMPNLKRLICPDCNAVTCASCRRLWEKEHQGISCEAFAAMKDATDPEAQAAGLAKMLTEDGISCPSCHFRYALAKGGCMHFRCIQCQHDFCSGCSRPFKMGQKCGVSEFCAKLGLHAHHPRNCLFYLRDKEPEDLQKLLDMNDVKYNREPPDGMEIQNTCQVMEQKETADGMVDDYCGKEVQDGFAGLCRVHYVEYLGQLVNKYKVDPIQIFDNDDLELVLRRANVRLPPKRYRESDAQYREKLINVIQEELPLDRMDGS